LAQRVGDLLAALLPAGLLKVTCSLSWPAVLVLDLVEDPC